jgi:hypothetical protein
MIIRLEREATRREAWEIATETISFLAIVALFIVALLNF